MSIYRSILVDFVIVPLGDVLTIIKAVQYCIFLIAGPLKLPMATAYNVQLLKGQCHEISCFWFFSWISFPQAPDYTIRAVSNFFKNSRRYSQFKVHHWCRWHQWQMEKIFNQKNFHYFFWTPFGSIVSILINFFFKFIWSFQQFDNCSHCLPPVLFTPVANLPLVSLIPVAISHRRRLHRWQICSRYRWHHWRICHRYQQH